MRKPMATPELLTALLTAFGPSGHEEEPSRIWREAATAFAEVTSDTLGTSFARVRAGDGARTLAIIGHIDEIGIADHEHRGERPTVVHADRGHRRRDAARPALRATDPQRRIPGAVSRKRIPPEQIRDRPRLEHADLHLDIGARSRAEAESARAGR